MKNRDKNIKNELAYFYTVIKNMDTKDSLKQSKIKKHEIPLDKVIYDSLSEDFNMDKELLEQDLLDWLELIENENLHYAVKNLSLEEQTLLSYIFEKEKTQRELERIYQIKHQSISKKLNKIILKLKHSL